MKVAVLQAEDGIRYLTVTGVQTCALPIYDGGRQVVEAEATRSDEVLAQDVPPVRDDDHRVALPRHPQGGADGEWRARPRDRGVDEVGRHEAHLGIHVGALRHAHALGWKRRYIRASAEVGRWV